MANRADPPVDLLPVDISPFKNGNTGIDYVHRFESGQAGPVVMINALTHGNELCGAHAVKHLMDNDVRLNRGTLMLSFANVEAYRRFDAANPTASRFVDEDLNRLWRDEVLDGTRSSAELARARQLRPTVAEADYLLDIHSMQLPSPALMLCGTQAKGRELALNVGTPQYVVADAGHRAGTRMRDYNLFADPANTRTALLIECGQHWQPASAEIAIEACYRFLLALDVIDREQASERVSAAPPKQTVIEVSDAVTIQDASFAFANNYVGMEMIAKAGTLIATEGKGGAEREIRTAYDNCVLIMPSRRLIVGQTAVRLGRLLDRPQ